MAKKKKKKWYDVEEASVVGGVKGVQMPLGAKSKKTKNNPSKPYGEKELTFEIRRIVKKGVSEKVQHSDTGEGWEVIDTRTGASHGTFPSRDAARAKQDQLGISVKRDPGAAKKSPDSQKKSTAKHRVPNASSNSSLEHVKKALRKALSEAGVKVVKEGSMISYMFEQAPVASGPSSLWETVVAKLPREMVMSDVGLAEVLQAMAVAEARVMARSVMEIKKAVEASGPFIVERKEADQDPVTGEVRMPFTVRLGENRKSDLLFAVKLENNKPIVLFPEASRNILNNMLTVESKALRAELMHVQETVLDKIEDVLNAGVNRDTYLEGMKSRLSEVVKEMNLVETMLLKNLIKEKLKRAKK